VVVPCSATEWSGEATSEIRTGVAGRFLGHRGRGHPGRQDRGGQAPSGDKARGRPSSLGRQPSLLGGL